MKQDNVVKLNTISDKLESNTPLRIIKMIHSIVAYVFLFSVIMTCVLYTHERLLANDVFISVDSSVPTKAEYEDGEQVEFYILAELKKVDSAMLHTVLRCDGHNRRGVEFISEEKSIITPSNTVDASTFAVVQTASNVKRNKISDNMLSEQLRTIVADGVQSVEYGGEPPARSSISSCYGDHTITTQTPIFNLPVVTNIRSYQFTYVWYTNNPSP